MFIQVERQAITDERTFSSFFLFQLSIEVTFDRQNNR